MDINPKSKNNLLHSKLIRNAINLQVEQLEQEVAELRQVVADKSEQEKAMLQVSSYYFFASLH